MKDSSKTLGPTDSIPEINRFSIFPVTGCEKSMQAVVTEMFGHMSSSNGSPVVGVERMVVVLRMVLWAVMVCSQLSTLSYQVQVLLT
jgi:hypothetical protein